MRNAAKVLLPLFVILLITATYADFGRIVNYQGKLTNDSGVPIHDVDVSIEYRLYDAATLGNQVWSQSGTVHPIQGLFSDSLDFTAQTFDFETYSALWLEVWVEGSQLTPRERLTSAFHALNIADTCVTLSKLSKNGASAGDIFQFDGTDWQLVAGTSLGDDDWTNVYGGLIEDTDSIYHTGLVGVGTATPDYQLDVNSGAALTAVHGEYDIDNYGELGLSNTGVYGYGTSVGVYGRNDGSGGLFNYGGLGANQYGAYGIFANDFSTSNNYGGYFQNKHADKVPGQDKYGVYAEASGLGDLGFPDSKYGVYAIAESIDGANTGVYAVARDASINVGMFSSIKAAPAYPASGDWAGYFDGNVGVVDTLALEVGTKIRDSDGDLPSAVGDVLAYDGTDYNWQAGTSLETDPLAWLLLGNAGTDEAVNFLGTTDDQALNFRVNNNKAGEINNDGQTFLGYEAGNSNTATNNIGLGYQALYSNTSGGNNVAVGYQALYGNTASSNTAVGYYALKDNTTGTQNAAVGIGALENFTTVAADASNYNTALGAYALCGAAGSSCGDANTAIGRYALYSNTTGCYNTASGFQALENNTTATGNTANGGWALHNNTRATYNTAVGYAALITQGTNDIAAATYNVAVGYQALNTNDPTGAVNARYNTAVGTEALHDNTIGSYNTAVGMYALDLNTTGNFNTAIGYNADVSAVGLTNATAIGNNASVSTSNTVLLGNNSVVKTEFNGALMPYYTGAYQPGSVGLVLTSQGADIAPQWADPDTLISPNDSDWVNLYDGFVQVTDSMYHDGVVSIGETDPANVAGLFYVNAATAAGDGVAGEGGADVTYAANRFITDLYAPASAGDEPSTGAYFEAVTSPADVFNSEPLGMAGSVVDGMASAAFGYGDYDLSGGANPLNVETKGKLAAAGVNPFYQLGIGVYGYGKLKNDGASNAGDLVCGVVGHTVTDNTIPGSGNTEMFGVVGLVDGDLGNLRVTGGYFEQSVDNVPEGYGVRARATGSATESYGVYAEANANSTTNYGVYSVAGNSNNTLSYGGYFRTAPWGTNDTTYGVYAYATGADIVSYGGYFEGFGDGYSDTAYGIYAKASGGTTVNWAGYFDAGHVRINNGLHDGASFGTSGQVLKTNGVGDIYWADDDTGAGGDHDWYEVGTTTPPDNINDNMFHDGGKVCIGITTVAGTSPKFHVVEDDGSEASEAVRIEFTDDTYALGTRGATIINDNDYNADVLKYGAFVQATGANGQKGAIYAEANDVGTRNVGGHFRAFGATQNIAVFGAPSASASYPAFGDWAGYFDGNVGISDSLDLSVGTTILDSDGDPPSAAGDVLVCDVLGPPNHYDWVPGTSLGDIDDDWVRNPDDPSNIPDSVLCSFSTGGSGTGFVGLARGGALNTMYGANVHTHINWGINAITGTNTEDQEYCVVGGGYLNDATKYGTTVAGGINNDATATTAAVCGGQGNKASGLQSFIGGGVSNEAGGSDATVAGGSSNKATGNYSFIGGGNADSATANFTTIAGGAKNKASGDNATIGGGYENLASGANATVSGGIGDTANWDYATVGGGQHNRADSIYATVSGGRDNIAGAMYATVGGGRDNVADGWQSVVAGGLRCVTSQAFCAIGGGVDNEAINTSTVGGGGWNSASAMRSTIAGGYADTASAIYSFVGAGFHNIASGNYAVATGGQDNIASNAWAFVGGGLNDTASGQYSVVSGGRLNAATSDYTTVAGGQGNKAANTYATVGGGISNQANGTNSTIAGGNTNTAGGANATVGGGYSNQTTSNYATIAGGNDNTASGGGAFIGGGYQNYVNDTYSGIVAGQNDTVRGQYAFIGAGQFNEIGAAGDWGVIGGGRDNYVTGQFGVIGGGEKDTVLGDRATVAGGYYNFIDGPVSGMYSTIGGGFNNEISGTNVAGATIAGGTNNTIGGGAVTASAAVIGGGNGNTATGQWATVPGGLSNTAAGAFSFAAGRRAKANHAGCFVWADQTDADYASTAQDQFRVYASGGLFIESVLDEAAPDDVLLLDAATNRIEKIDVYDLLALASADDDWVRNPDDPSDIPDSVLCSFSTGADGAGYVGLARGGALNSMSGGVQTQVNFGVACTTANQGATISGGYGAYAGNYGTISGGYTNKATGYAAAIGGGYENLATGDRTAIAGGFQNDAAGDDATIAGGMQNEADGPYSFIGGGYMNDALDSFAIVVGGRQSRASQKYTFIGGGYANYADSAYAAVVGGTANRARGDYSFIGAGNGNIVWAGADHAGIASGIYNRIEEGAYRSFIGAGHGNDIAGSMCFIGNGYYDTITVAAGTNCASIVGGYNNVIAGAIGSYSAILGGRSNRIIQSYSSIAGGYRNKASHSYVFIGGGDTNVVTGQFGVIGGGRNNRIDGTYSTIAGADSCYISNGGWYAFIGGGRYDSVTAWYGVVPGGMSNKAAGRYSFAAGRRAKALDDGCFVWADSTNADYSTTGDNQFRIRATGGIFIETVPDDPTQDSVLSIDEGQVKKIWVGDLGGDDDDWQRGYDDPAPLPDTVLCSWSTGADGAGYVGLARGGALNDMYGDSTFTQINWGVNSITGESGQTYGAYATVSGGYRNHAHGSYATIGGGENNDAGDIYNTIGGGEANSTRGMADYGAVVLSHNTIGGGYSNRADSVYSTVGGGYNNHVLTMTGTIAGGNNNAILIGTDARLGFIGGGYADSIMNGLAAVIGGGWHNKINSGSYTFIGSGRDNYINATNGMQSGAIVAGYSDSILSGESSFIGAGSYNLIDANYGVIAGGERNRVTDDHSVVGGGRLNEANGDRATIAGGQGNVIVAGTFYGSIGGGDQNIDSSGATIGGGYQNVIMSSSSRATIAGGYQNIARGAGATVAGGRENYTATDGNGYSTIGGGYYNAGIGYTTIAGGYGDTISGGQHSAIGGGNHNVIESGLYSTIAGGQLNNIDAGVTGGGTIGGGVENTVSSTRATVSGGYQGTASGQYSTVAGGYQSAATGDYSVISGGYIDTASASYAIAAGGYHNVASGNYTTAIGGRNNTVGVGSYGVIIGGNNNLNTGNYAFFGGGQDNYTWSSWGAIVGGRADTLKGSYSGIFASESCYVYGNHSYAFGKRVRLTTHDRSAFYSPNHPGRLGINTSPDQAALHVLVSGPEYGTAGNLSPARAFFSDYTRDTTATTYAGYFKDDNDADAAVGKYALYADALGTGATATNYALYANAENAGTNWAGYFANGDVNIDGGLRDGASFGTVGQVLTADGAGNMSWQDPVGADDDDWVRGGDDPGPLPDSVLCSYSPAAGAFLGLARGGANNQMLGDSVQTHVNWGINSTTGAVATAHRWCTVSGGYDNRAAQAIVTVGGGYQNRADGHSSTIAGGRYNSTDAVAVSATVGGGRSNQADNEYAVVAGGYMNVASGQYSVISGGYNSDATGNYAMVGGGNNNQATANYAAIASGQSNSVSDANSFIGGGQNNSITDNHSVIGGGLQNNIQGYYSFIGGGYNDTIYTTNWGVICGGDGNVIEGSAGRATIVGGWDNRVNAGAGYSFIGGGHENYVSAGATVIGGGENDTASGQYSTVPGGKQNRAGGKYSFAAGRRAKAMHAGSFVWADSTDSDFASTAAQQFCIRATNGIHVDDGTIDDDATQDSLLTIDGGEIKKMAVADLPGGSVTLQEAYDADDNDVLMTAGHGDIVFFNDASDTLLCLDESSGYVGIGKRKDPHAPLSVYSGIADGLNEAIRVSGGSGNAESGVSINFNNRYGGDSYPDWITGSIGSVVEDDINYWGHLVFLTNDGGGDADLSEKMRITYNGTTILTHNVADSSGLRLAQLTSASAAPAGYGKVLTVDADGDVYLVQDGGAVDSDWSDSTNADGDPYMMAKAGGIAGNTCSILGTNADYQVCFGSSCTTGTAGSALGIGAVVSGGVGNAAVSHYSAVAGGWGNRVDNTAGFIGGGRENVISAGGPAGFSVICGGAYDTIYTKRSFIGGGRNNVIEVGFSNTIVGGEYNRINNSSGYGAILGGYDNYITGDYSVVSGGYGDTVSGDYSVVPGGSDNKAAGNYSFAAGRRAKADHHGSFVWADSTDANYASTGDNQFCIRATNGIHVADGTIDDDATQDSLLTIDGGEIKKMAVADLSIGGGDAWLIDGNDDIVSGKFLGTTNAATYKPIDFKVADSVAGQISDAGPTFIGYQAGNVNTQTQCTGFGYQALYTNTTGAQNTAVGHSALYSNNGNYNTAVGFNSLRTNATGARNTAVGYFSLMNNTVSGNTGVGYYALMSNTSGANNTAMGGEALRNNDTGTNNTATGLMAMYSFSTGHYNTAVGSNALRGGASASGSQNTALGTNAMYCNTTGSQNVAIGYQALDSNTTATGNISIGSYSMYQNKRAGYNTAIGHAALRTQGANDIAVNTYNVAVGYEALFSNDPSAVTNGLRNTAVGTKALYSNTTGYYNTAVGDSALYSNTTGTNNTALGYNADVSAGGWSNSMALGANTSVTASNRIHIGDASIGWIGGQVSWSTYSDKRAKNNVREDIPGLSFVTKLEPVSFNWDVDALNNLMGVEDRGEWDGKYDIEKTRISGFLAQDVADAARACDYDFSGIDSTADVYSLSYGQFVVPLVKAVQELDAKVEKLSTATQNISDFGREDMAGTDMWVNFSKEFSDQLAENYIPVVTVTPNCPSVVLCITETTREGFRVVGTTGSKDGFSFNWIAMAKVAAEQNPATEANDVISE